MIALIGASGYIGSHFVKGLKGRFKKFITLDGLRYPLKENELIQKLIKSGIHTVINCGGFTGKPNVDQCETEQKQTTEGNVFLPVQIAKVCRDLGIEFHHVSSGCIYTDPLCDDARDPVKVFTEEDEPNFNGITRPASWYSITKALGEEAILKESPYAFIWRIRIPFSGDGSPRDYITKVLTYKALLNATNSLTYLPDFVNTVLNHVTHRAFPVVPMGGSRVFNAVQPGHITTSRVCQIINERLKAHEIPAHQFQFFSSYADFRRTVATDRSNCALSPAKLIRAGAWLKGIEEAVTVAVDKHIEEGNYNRP